MRTNRLIAIVLITLITFNCVLAQVDNSVPLSDSKFHVGLFYEYLNFSLKVNSIEYTSVWEGYDLGTSELEQDVINELNIISDINKIVQGPMLNFGYTVYNKKNNPFFIDINVAVGVAFKNYEIVNTETNQMAQTFKTDRYNHWYGINLLIKYDINNIWGVQFVPACNYSWGNTEDIVDNINPVLINYSEKRSDKSNIIYLRSQLMASFTLGDICFLAGPGFYYANNKHELTIEKRNLEDGSQNIDIYKMKLQSLNFVDFSLSVNWNFMKHFSFKATGGISNDYFILSGITYQF